MKVAVVPTRTANLASVRAGLRRAGGEPVEVEDPDAVRRAERLVLPGVGALAAAMTRLGEAGLAEPLAERVREGRPTLAICLGLQILLEGSEESPGVPGLGVVGGVATRFTGDVRVPQLGWNRVEPEGCAVLRPGYAYFAHSYRLTAPPSGWSCAWTEHGGRYVSAIERGPVLACQFHPELSGAWGTELLGRWLSC